MSMQWSDQQEAFFDWFSGGPSRGNAVGQARAGTGKTTTILEGVNRAPEKKILVAAFNKKIATELQQRVRNPNVKAQTLHSLGYSFVMANWGRVKLDDNKERPKQLAQQAVGSDEPKPMIAMIARLMTLGREMAPFAKTPDDLLDIAYDFECVPEDHWEENGWTVERVCEHAVTAMKLACKTSPVIDFTDMLYLPVANNWITPRYELTCIDEAQDMNACQLILAQKVTKKAGRIIVVGDDRQAIYGFRGADSDSLNRLQKELNATVLPLTITYRCPKKVVEEANRICPDYHAAPDAPEGEISNIEIRELPSKVSPGDFVLSRTNALLTKACMDLIRNRVRARIEGRDIGQRLKNITKNLVGKSYSMQLDVFLEKLGVWEMKEVAKATKAGRDSRVALVQDQAETLRVLCEDIETTTELNSRIDDLFGEIAQQEGVVVCSSVHKAKGLESQRVFILRASLYPGRRDQMSADRLKEESNIEYVAITRSMNELVWVNGRYEGDVKKGKKKF